MPDAPAVTEAPDNSAPVQTTQTPTLGATPQETFRNAMKAEADAAGARSQQADPAPAPKAETKPTSTADDIPEALLSPKKTEAPPADVPPELHGNVSPRTREHFDRQKQHYEGKLKTHQDEAAALRKEIESYKASNGKPSAEYQAALDAAVRERDELNTRLERFDYQNSPAFHEKFTAKEERLRKVAENIFDDAAMDKSVLNQALAMTGKRRDDFLDEQELGPTTKARLASVLGQLDVLGEERNAEVGTAREKLSAMRAQELAERKAQEDQEMAQEKEVFERLKKTVPDRFLAFREVPGDEAWNATIAERHQKVHQLAFGNNDNETLYQYAYAAVAAEATEKINEKLMKKVEMLEARLAGTLATEPGTNGRDKPPASAEEEMSRMTPDQRARAEFNRHVRPVLGY